MRHIRIPFCLVAAASANAWAQQQDTDPLPQLREVVVIAPAIKTQPASSSGLDETGLMSLRPSTSDTASLLRNIPGVSLYGAGGVSSLPAIHGLADDRLNTQVDGMNLMPACPNHMNPALSYIDPSSVGSVKVYSGIVPVSVGGDAIGATIQVDSAVPKFAAPGQGTITTGEVGAFYRSNGSARGGNISATQASENISVTYTGSTAKSNDYTAAQNFHAAGTGISPMSMMVAPAGVSSLNANEVGSTAYHSINQELSAAYKLDNNLFQLKVGWQTMPYEYFPNQRMDMTQNNNTNLQFQYTGQFDWGTLEGRLYNQQTHHKMNFGQDKAYWYIGDSGYPDVPGMPMNTDAHTTGGLIKGNLVLDERNILRLGTEFQNYTLNDKWPAVYDSAPMMAPDTFFNVNDGQRDRIDLFGEWESRWSKEWMSLIGVRYDRVSMNAGNVQGYCTSADAPMCAMTNYEADATAFNSQNHRIINNNWNFSALSRYTPDSRQTYEGGYSLQTRSPNLFQLYPWATNSMIAGMNNFVGDGNGYIGNPNLKPEMAHTLSFTANLHDTADEHWGLKVTPYYSYVTNYIDAQRCNSANCLSSNPQNLTTTNQFVLLQYVNQTAELYGIDISGRMPLARLASLGSFTANGVVSYTRGKNLSTGDNLYDIMPLNAKLAIVQKLNGWTNAAEVQMVAAKTDISAVRNEMQTPGYALLNLRASYQWQKVRFDFGIENVFNKFYDLPLGGAYLGQGATMMMNYETPSMGSAWGTPVPGMGRSIYTGINCKF